MRAPLKGGGRLHLVQGPCDEKREQGADLNALTLLRGGLRAPRARHAHACGRSDQVEACLLRLQDG